MEPVYMILGHAAGVGASLAIDERTPVQKVDLRKLRAKLQDEKAVLSPDEIRASGSEVPRGPGIVIDDPEATKTGEWTPSTSTPPFVGAGYVHDGNADRGKKSIRFSPKLPEAGSYEVVLIYPPHANRASNTLVVVHFEGGETPFHVDQRKAATPLGTFRFPPLGGWVEIRNDGADGYVVADAVRFILAK
jgi:hypothetical protein